MSMKVISRDRICGITSILVKTDKYGITLVELWLSCGNLLMATYSCEDGHTEKVFSEAEVERYFPGIMKLA